MNRWRAASVLPILFSIFSFASSSSAKSVIPLQAVEFRGVDAQVVSNEEGLVRVTIQLHANIAAEANLAVEYPEAIKLATTEPREQTILLSSGESTARTFDLVVQDRKPSRVFFRIEAANPPTGFLPSAQRFVTMYFRDGHTYVSCSDEASTGQAIEVHPLQGPLEGQVGEKIFHTVSISGVFQFPAGDGVAESYGVYGAGCRLWFYNPSTEMWWHPVLGNIQHTHFDFIGEDGSFSFDFSFDANLGNYNQIWIQVSCVNDATVMPAPDDGYMVWHDGGYTPYLGDNDAIIIENIDVNSPDLVYNVANTFMRQDYSSLLRNLMMSREFVEEVYNGSLTFSLPHVYSRVANQDPGIGGMFISCGGLFDGDPPRIEIDPDAQTLPWVIDHEYGHFDHYCSWGQDCSAIWENDDPYSSIMKEGWAIFYNAAARGYAERTYGDEHLWDASWTDQTEPTPFRDPRYSGIGYQTVGHADYCAYGCYLASIFDGYEDSGFEAAPYLDGDNDDISGHHRRVFETLRTMDKGPTSLQPDLFHAKFKDGLPADVQLSADQILNFMFADLEDVPTDADMRPAQVYQLEATVPHSGRVELQWQSQEYYPQSYSNTADGYRVYREDGGWTQIADLPWGSSGYVFEDANVGGLYKVTSYSAIAGEACLPEETSISVSAVPGSDLQAYRISGVYPNPFNPTTKIGFSLAQAAPVRIEVFSVDGRLVRTLFSGQKDSGDHEVFWDGRNDSGNEVASGQYFCQLTSGGMRDARKLMLVK